MTPATVVISGLQTEQGTLIGISGFPRGARKPRGRVTRAPAIERLATRLRARPHARVRTFYYADDSLLEKGGRTREILSLRELAQRETDTDRAPRSLGSCASTRPSVALSRAVIAHDAAHRHSPTGSLVKPSPPRRSVGSALSCWCTGHPVNPFAGAA